MTGDAKFPGESPILAYLASVTMGAITVALYMSMAIFFDDRSTPAIDAFFAALMMTTLVFVIGWVFCFFTAFVPFVAVMFVAKKLKIKSPLYFITCATLTSLFWGNFFVWSENDATGGSLNVGKIALTTLQPFTLAGLVAGITCWRVIRPR